MSVLAALLPSRRRNRKRVESRTWRWPDLDWQRLGSAFAGVAGVVALACALALALNRPVRTVAAEGAFQRVSPLDVERVVRERLTGGFVTANLAGLQAAIEELPWVDRARVQRRWPDGLAVQVTEQVPAARWGATGLLNTRGELFLQDARHVPPELPSLAGPAGTQREVAALYLQLQPRLLQSGLRVASVRLDTRGSWEVDLSNGVTVRLGRRLVQERLERFLHVGAPVVAGRPSDIASVDMRYSNGFSVGWRTAARPAGTAPSFQPAAVRERDGEAY